MRIVILNGSPKGQHSFTLQYSYFIEKAFPQHEFEVIHVSQLIKKLEKDEDAFQSVIDKVKAADAVLWVFGLYILAAPAQLMRFVELIGERGSEDAFKGKYAAVLTTSIHYFDHTAHNYMRSVCEDLGMRFVDALSMDVIDLWKEKPRRVLRLFAENFLGGVENQAATSRWFKPLVSSPFEYTPSEADPTIDPGGKKIVVLTDTSDETSNLGKMIERFTSSFSGEVEAIDLNDIDIKSGCLGCMKCGYDYTCVQKDGFREFYDNRVLGADCLVFAGEVKGRYLSSKWKQFYDRAFCYNHTPTMVGKQIGYLISGPLSQVTNLRQILIASVTARQEANLVDIITDEVENSEEMDAAIRTFSQRLVDYAEKGYVRTWDFLAVGGHKIFRDDVWGRLRMIWQADHRYYRKHGWYDFPQKNIMFRILNPVMFLLCKIPRFRKGFYASVVTRPSQRLRALVDKKA